MPAFMKVVLMGKYCMLLCFPFSQINNPLLTYFCCYVHIVLFYLTFLTEQPRYYIYYWQYDGVNSIAVDGWNSWLKAFLGICESMDYMWCVQPCNVLQNVCKHKHSIDLQLIEVHECRDWYSWFNELQMGTIFILLGILEPLCLTNSKALHGPICCT